MRELDRRGVSVIRLNSERSPHWEISLEPGRLWRIRRGERALLSEDCAGVWWRRPEVPATPGAGPAAEAVAAQWRAFLAGLATVPGPVWVSEPASIRAAEDKAVQLAAARELGFAVPATLWTNHVGDALGFEKRHGNAAVVKSVASAWWEEAGRGRFVFASKHSPEQMPAPAALASSPVCFQQPVSPKQDIRVTVIGGTVLAAIRVPEATGSEPLDWRLSQHAPWQPYSLRPDVAQMCRRLTEGLQLRFAGIDLALAGDGELWFLELNPNGEWGWLQQAGLRIAEAMCDTLSPPRAPATVSL